MFANAYGTRSGQENFNSKFDLDGDGRIGFSGQEKAIFQGHMGPVYLVFYLFANAYGKPVSG